MPGSCIHRYWQLSAVKRDVLFRAQSLRYVLHLRSWPSLYRGKAAETPPSTAITAPVVRDDSSLNR